MNWMGKICAGEEPALGVSKAGLCTMYSRPAGTNRCDRQVGRPVPTLYRGRPPSQKGRHLDDPRARGKTQQKNYIAHFNSIPVLVFPREQLKVRKFNRVIMQVKDLDDFALIERLSLAFDIRDIDVSKLPGRRKGLRRG